MKALFQLLVIIALFTFASSASALTIDNVGDVDTLIGVGTQGEDLLSSSGDQAEVDFVNAAILAVGVTGVSFTIDDMNKTQTEDGAGWEAVDGVSSVYAYDFDTYEPSYFLVKIGGGGINSLLGTHFLFNNYNDYGVVALWQFIGGDVYTDLPNNLEFTRFSHIDTFGAAPVPEPSTLLLLGAGITGLVFYRRKK